MTPELLTTHAVAEKIVETLLSNGEPGLVISIDVGGSLFDVVAANAAEFANCTLVTSHTLLRRRAALSRQGPQLWVATVLEQPMLFGRVDGWLWEADNREPCNTSDRRTEKFATHKIDSWSVGRPPLRLVHFGDPELVADQLRGAAGTIARDRPVVTLYTAGQQKAELITLLKSVDYGIFNLSGEPVESAEPDPLVDFGWIAVPAELQDEIESAAAHAMQYLDRIPSRWDIETSRRAPIRQRRSAGIFGLLSGASRPLAFDRNIPAKDILCLNDCYALETAGDHSWRWLGPRERTRIAVPCPLPLPYTIQLRVIGCKLKNGLADCRIIVEGREVSTNVGNSLPGYLSFPAAVEPNLYTGHIEIDIVSGGELLPADGDRRTLHLCLESILVSPWR